MNRMMFAAMAVGAALLLSVCGGPGNKGPGDWDTIKKLDKHENAALKIALDGSRCVLTEAPEQIRARPGQRVTFLIEGNCNETDRIGIGRFQPNADPFETIRPVGAQDGQVLAVILKRQPPLDHGLWHYEVLVNDSVIGSGPSAKQSRVLDFVDAPVRAQESYVFAICPEWPCNRY